MIPLRKFVLLGGLLLGLVGYAPLAVSHAGSASYVEFSRDAEEWRAQLDVPLADVAEEFQLDRDGDGALSWGEVLDAETVLNTAYAQRLSLDSSRGTCRAAGFGRLDLVRRATGTHLRLQQRYGQQEGCTADAIVNATAWLAALPEHGVYLTRADVADQVTLLSGSVATAPLAVDATRATALANAQRFLLLGFEHLVTGYDHLAFLGLLLLGIARTRAVRNATASVALLEAARIVTAFTIAHSLTLALAATGVVSLPVAPVELAIAASIVVTAAAVALGWGGALGWRVAFAFGLVHGFGFANLLGELLTGGSLAIPLALFNVGLELGQLALVILALPCIVWLTRRPALSARAIPVAAVAFGLLGGFWLVERW